MEEIGTNHSLAKIYKFGSVDTQMTFCSSW